MFKQNKYTKWYFQIIESAKNQNHEKYETHHIVPRCLGGSDSPENLVRLSYRQHYIAHALLTKMHDSPKIANAFWQMSFKNKKKYFNSNLYNIARSAYSERISGDAHWAKTEEFRQLVSSSWTNERKKKFAEKVGGENHWSKHTDMTNHAAKMRQSIDIEKVSAMARKQMLENNPMKNPEIAAKFKKPKEKITCNVCGKTGGKPVMVRYHFEKCKWSSNETRN